MPNNVSGKFLFVCIILLPSLVDAMGLRSFVALPVEKGGGVVRLTSEYNDDSEVNQLRVNMTYGWIIDKHFYWVCPIDYHQVVAIALVM